MTRVLLPLLLLFGFGKSQEFAINDFSVSIYPEYYYPGVMVDYSGEVQASNLPVSVRFYVPAETDSVFQILEQDESEHNILRLPVTQSDEEAWITLSLNESQFRIFVFYQPFGTGPERKFDYTIKSDRDLAEFHLTIQEPLMAEGFALSLKDTEPITDQHGLKFHRQHVINLPAETPKNVSVSYSNPSGRTTMSSLQTMLNKEPSVSGTQDVRERPVVNRYRLPIWEPLLVLGVLSVFVGTLFYYQRKKEQTLDTEKAQFCRSCGIPVKSGDKFCANCGTKI